MSGREDGDRMSSSNGCDVSHTRTAPRVIIALGLILACALVVGSTIRTGSARAVSAAPWRATNTDSDSTDAARVVERFHRALAHGDSAAALALLAPDATILESGGSESVAEYRAHHLPADIEFARAVKEVRTPPRVTVRGNAAWAVATSTARGTFRGRPVDSMGAELIVLTRSPEGWRIAAIHWSSRKRGT
jgi:ketosteroid isomerase-like protein